MAQKILVADDEQYVHWLLRHHLTRAGYEMLIANNGLEVLEIAARDKPHLIVLDVMMPEMDGLTALRELKKSEVTRDIPVIVITTNAHRITRTESETFGAALFLTKPFSPAQLLAEIRQLIPQPAS
jgi:CheY-like chemotaxis protein